MRKTLHLAVFGKEALEIAKLLGLEMSEDYTDVNTKVFLKYRSIEGHPKIEIEFDI
jgi:hypothetical protein